MDRRQKSALRSSHTKLADQLILDEDFYAALRQNKIFTDGMLEIIKNEKKDRAKVYKMLELLEKRGPDAFNNFVNVLKINFNWLADMLQDEYAKKRPNVQPVVPGHQEETNVKYTQASTQVTSSSSWEQSPVSGHFTFNPHNLCQGPYTSQYTGHHACCGSHQDVWTTNQEGQLSPNQQGKVTASQHEQVSSNHLGQVTFNQQGQVATGHMHQGQSNYPVHCAYNHLGQGTPSLAGQETTSQSGQEITSPPVQTRISHPIQGQIYQPGQGATKQPGQGTTSHLQKVSSQPGLGTTNQTGQEKTNPTAQVRHSHLDQGLNSQATANYPREYKDACMSPIEVIESPRKPKRSSSARPSPLNKATTAYKDENVTEAFMRNSSKVSFKEQEEVVLPSPPTHSYKADNVPSLHNGRRQRFTQYDNTDGYSRFRKNNEDNNNNEADDNDGDVYDDDDNSVFPTSEEFYNDVRRSSMAVSSEYQDEILQTDDFFDDLDTSIRVHRYNEENESDYSRSESALSSNHVLDAYIEPMWELYDKLVGLNGGNASDAISEPRQSQSTEHINWEMINNEVDKLAQQLRDSDDSKMIQECYKLFQERERRKPLNTCIYSLMSEMKDLKKINIEKSKEIERMAQDMYNHFKEMNDIKRLKQSIQHFQDEVRTAKSETDVLEKKLAEKDSLIHELERKNQFLQSKFLRDPSPEKEKVVSPRKSTSQNPKGAKGGASKPRGSAYMGMERTRNSLYSKPSFSLSPRTSNATHFTLSKTSRR